MANEPLQLKIVALTTKRLVSHWLVAVLDEMFRKGGT